MKHFSYSFLVATALSLGQVTAQDFWQPANGPYAGLVYALAVNANGHIFAGTDYGLFRSTDNGNRWTAINTGLADTEVLSLAIAPASGDIFAGTDGGGVFRSTNNGDSWTAANTGLSNRIIQSLAVNASGQIFAGTNQGGAYRSTNNGASWTPINTGLTNNDIQALAINASGHIFAGTYRGGVFRSTDNGNSWTQFLPGTTNSQNDVRSLAINASGHIFAGTFGGGVYRSTDNGGTWTRTSTNLTAPYVFALAINANGDIFAGTAVDIGNAGVFRSTNNGDSWTKVSAGLADDDVASLAINPTTRDIFAGTEGGGVFRSVDNGNNWETASTGLTGYVVDAMAINPVTGDLFAGTSYGLFRSTDNGNTWARVPSGFTNSQTGALVINGSGHIFAAFGPARSTDNGDNWTRIDAGLPSTLVTALALNSSGHLFAGTLSNGIYRSTNNGDTWTEINNGLTNKDINALAINANGDIFAGTSSGAGRGIFRSTDFGDTWIPVNNGLPSVGSIEVLAINASGHIFAAATSEGVFRSTNNGDTWTKTGLHNIFVQTLAINSAGYIFAGTFFDGALRSRDNGDTWTPINTGLPVKRNDSFAIDSNQFLFAGTGGGGVLRSVLPTTAIAAPAAPQLSLPPNGATNRTTTLTLTWGASFEAETYRLQVSTNAAFTTTVFDDSTLTTTSRQVGPLANNTTHYWRVKAKNTGGSSAWSTVWSFTTLIAAPTAPALASPANGALNQPTSLALSWNASTSATTYRLQLSTSSAFTTTVFDDSTLTATSQQVGSLANNTTYHWRVKAKNAGGSSAWSPVWSFTTIVAVPTAPALASPVDGAMNQPTTLALSWNSAANATTYRLQVSTNSVFTTTVFDDSTITTISRQIGPLANNTPHYWRVKAKNVAGSSAWSAVRSFTTIIAAPSAPTLASPPNAAVNQPVTLALSWNPSTNAATYRLQVATNSTFAATVFDDSTLTTTSRQIGPLANNMIHFWRVQAKNVGGNSAWSEIRRFTTIVQLPGLVALLVPQNSAVISTDTVRFVWRQSAPAINLYWFELATDSLMTNAMIDSALTDTIKTVRQLHRDQTYWWRVRARNLAGFGSFSEQRKFHIMITSIDVAEDMPREFRLSQNYPNPFNPSTTIEYALPQPSHVELKIYDVLGNEVQILVNGKQTAGVHRVQFDSQGLPGGVYFYRLRAGERVEVKKMMLVR